MKLKNFSKFSSIVPCSTYPMTLTYWNFGFLSTTGNGSEIKPRSGCPLTPRGILSGVFTSMYVSVHTHMYVCTHTCMHLCTHMHTHTYMQTYYIHTYIHAYINA